MFAKIWQQHDAAAPCNGIRQFQLGSEGVVDFAHRSLTIDDDKHLRLVYYHVIDEANSIERYQRYLAAK